MSRIACLICPGGGGGGGYKTNGGWIYGFVLGGLHYRKSDVRVGCLICPGVCVRRMVGNGVQGGYMGLLHVAKL